MRSARLAVLTILVALGVASPADAQRLTVYSSLPLQGASSAQAKGIVAGMRLALSDAGGTAGGRPVRYVSLDDSTRRAGTWTPEAVSHNARRAAADSSAIAYLGEFNSGATAISLPILNEAGIMQISPSNTAVGLTRQGPGADRGEPDKYYPTGLRSYARVIPNDVVQGAASAALLKQLGAKRVLVVHDGEVYGRGVSRAAVKRLRALGVRITGFRALGRAGRRASAIARAARNADAVFYGGITANGAPRLWKALARSKRTLKLVGSDGVAESGFTERIPRSVAARTYVMVATLAREAYPAAGQGVFDRLGANPDPYALYGYEAMALALDAINRGGPTKQGAIEALYATQDRDSVLGRYSIDDRGDTTLGTYGVYRIDRGALVFDRAVDAGTG